MATIDEEIARAYFERHGFLVRAIAAPDATPPHGRRRNAPPVPLLAVLQPNPGPDDGSGDFLLFPNTIRRVHRAVVAILGDHFDRITPARIRAEGTGGICADAGVLRAADEAFGPAPAPPDPAVTRLLVLPGLPLQEPARREATALLRANGVDAVLTFRSILLDLAEGFTADAPAPASAPLAMLRLLRGYDLVRDAQLELELRRDGPNPPRRRPHGR